MESKIKEYRIRVWVGPCFVAEIGARTGADMVGTEHCSYHVHAESEHDAEEYVRRLFVSRGLHKLGAKLA